MSLSSETNHRACSRTPLDLSAILYRGTRPALPGRLIDISFGGVYIETDADAIGVNELVTVGFLLEGRDRRLHEYSLSAVVVRKTRAGVGLAFQEIDDYMAESMRKVYMHALA